MSSCYKDCNASNQCGGIKYYPNTCYDKTAVYAGDYCVNEIVGYTYQTVTEYWGCGGMGSGHDWYGSYTFYITDYDANTCATVYTSCEGKWGNPPPSWCYEGLTVPGGSPWYTYTAEVPIYEYSCTPTYNYVCE